MTTSVDENFFDADQPQPEFREGTLPHEQAERLSSGNGAVAKPRPKQVQLHTGVATVRVASATALSLDGLLDVLDELTKELKKARSQSLDVSTAVLVLRDRAKQRQTVEVIS